MDDFLFLSTTAPDAQQFLAVMRRGFPAHNVQMNFAKTQSSVPAFGVTPAPLLVWNGLIVDTMRGEVRADYSRRAHASLPLQRSCMRPLI